MRSRTHHLVSEPNRIGAATGLRVFLAGLGLQLIGGILVGVLFGLTLAIVGGPDAATQIKAQYGSLLVACGALAGLVLNALYLRFRGQQAHINGTAAHIGLEPMPSWRNRGLLMGAGLGVFWMVAAVLISLASGAPKQQGAFTQVATSYPLVWMLCSVLLAPWIEERTFRGYLFAGLQNRWGTRAAAFLVTATFLALHIPEVRYFPAAGVSVAALGVLTVWLRIRTGSIYPGYYAHLAYNGVLAILVAVSTLLAT